MAEVPARRSGVPWSLWRFCCFVFARVIRAPIASGRLKDNGWPPGLRGIVAAWAVLYAAMAAAAVFSSAIRSHSPLLYEGTTTLPAAAVPLVTVAYAFALTCVYTAGLHLVWWLRVPVTLVVVAFLLGVADLVPIRLTDVPVVLAAVLLVVLLAVRWGRAFHWSEFVAALVVIGHVMLLAVVFAPGVGEGFAFDAQLNALMLIAGYAWILALPAGIVAGAALVELTFGTVAWTVTGVWQSVGSRRRRSPGWGVAALTVLGVLRAVQVGWHVWSGDVDYRPARLLPTGVILVLVFAACTLTALRADRVRDGDPPLRPDPDDLLPTWSTWSIVLAVLLGVTTIVPLVLSQLLPEVGLDRAGEVLQNLGGQWQLTVLVLPAAVIALCMAYVRSGRGERVAPLILTAVAVWWVGTTLSEQFDLLYSAAGLTVTASLCALAVFVWLAIRRRLTAVRGVAVAAVLVLSGVLQYRDVLEEPLTAVFSLVGVSAAILVGLVWRMLTDNGYSRGDSRRFPRPSRVLVTLALTTYGVTSIGFVALVGGQWPYDINVLETAGDKELGLGLACAAFFAGLSLAARGRLVRPEQPRDDYGRLLASPHPSDRVT
ncbi:MAG TPA: hypothetical protein VF053_19215 [Streptosporangiales bacterium]